MISFFCPHCNTDIAQWKSQHDYADQLIITLYHPIPTTPVIAAQILGERREKKAVPELIRVMNETSDAYLAEAAVEALSKIDNAEAIEAVRAARGHRFARVRVRAREALLHAS